MNAAYIGQDYLAVEDTGPNHDGKRYLDPSPDPGAAGPGAGAAYTAPAAVSSGDSLYFDPAQKHSASYFDPAATSGALGNSTARTVNPMYQGPPEPSNAGIYQEVQDFSPADTAENHGARKSGPVHYASPAPLYMADVGGQTSRPVPSGPSGSTPSEGLYADADAVEAGPTHFYPG